MLLIQHKRPFSAIDHWDWQDQAALSGAEVIARFGDRYQKMKAAQIDAYSAFKLGYIQYREAQFENRVHRGRRLIYDLDAASYFRSAAERDGCC